MPLVLAWVCDPPDIFRTVCGGVSLSKEDLSITECSSVGKETIIILARVLVKVRKGYGEDTHNHVWWSCYSFFK